MAVYGDELYHYGIPRKSGRYPYGSGKEPYQDDPRKRRLNKDESAPKAKPSSKASTQKTSSKKPESVWAKHRRLQAEKRDAELRKAKRKAAVQAEAAKPPSQKAKEMSDEELVRAINRLRLEQTYMSMINPSNQQSQQQQAQQQAQKIKTTVDKGKRLIDKMKSGSKDIADLSQNIGNIMGGAQKAYANYKSIMKLMDVEKKRKGS